MDAIELVLAMVLAVVAGGYLVRLLPFPLPLPLAQIALGALIAEGFRQSVVLNPEIFFLLFLPPLLFLDGWRIPKGGPFRDKAAILELALGLVIFTVIGAGFLIHWLIPAMPAPVAFALAAIVSPTDPVAVSSITARVPIPKRLMRILQGESLLNDASGLVCFRFAVAAAVTGSFSLTSASLTFLWVVVAGLCIGVGITMLVSFAQGWLSRHSQKTVDSEIYIHAATYVLALYRHRLEGSSTSPSEAVQLRATEEAERVLRLTALQAERDKIFSLARYSRISIQTSRKLVREIDLVESRYR